MTITRCQRCRVHLDARVADELDRHYTWCPDRIAVLGPTPPADSALWP